MGDPGRQGGPTLTAPRPVRAPVRQRTWRVFGLGAGAVVLGTAVMLLRQPGAGALNTVWAEDGTIFLAGATTHGFAAVGTSYAGYFHAVPRLLSGLAALAPAGAAAPALAIMAAACTALVAVLVYVASAQHLSSRLARVLASAVVIAVPVGQDDLLNSIANLHWYGLYALFWVLIWTPRSRAGRIVAVSVVVLVSLSDILVLAFLPLAVWRARRDRFGAVLSGLLGVGLAVQFGGLLFGSSSRELSPNPVRGLSGYVLRAVPEGLLGERWFGTHIDARWFALAALAWLVVGAAAVLAWTDVTRPAWPLALTAAAHSLALYVLPVLLSGTATPRYAVAPAMLLVTALAAALQPGGTAAGLRLGGPGTRAAAPLYLLALLLATVWAANLRLDNERAHGPRWTPAVTDARARCASASGAGSVDVPISPGGQEWSARLPCSYVS